MLRTAFLSLVFLPVFLRPGAAQSGGDLEKRVDRLFAAWDRTDSPGCALGVVTDGELVLSKAYGMADLESNQRLTPDHVFYMASVSKQFTAASVALLALDGKVSLDDDVRRYVPELPDYGPTVTLRHLVHHTSGLRDYLELMIMAGMPFGDEYDRGQILSLVARQEELNFEPGAQHLYSNTGYFLIPIIVERVTGQTIREFMGDRAFEPLGMADTRFHDDYRRPVERRAFSYGPKDGGGFERTFLDKFDQVGSGGLLSTVSDMVQWDQNAYHGSVGGRELIDLMHTRGVLNDGDTLAYAFGLTIGQYKGLPTVGHGGSMMGFRTHLLRFPEQRLSVICLCNLGTINPAALAEDVSDLYLRGAIEAQLAAYTGRYHSPELGVTWAVETRDAELFVDRGNGGEAAALTYREPDTFGAPGGATVIFARDRSEVTGFRVRGGRAQGIRFRRVNRGTDRSR